jgi:putative PEP-CTERM system TPR-repeat lipoprotein
MNKTSKFLRSAAATALIYALIAGCSSENTDAMLASAKTYLDKNEIQAGIIQLKNALKSNPDLGEARYLLGKAFLETGDPVAAESELRKAAEAHYPADSVVPMLTESMLQQGEFRKVIDEFGKSTAPASLAKAAGLTAAGKAQFALGDRDAAGKTFAAVLAADAHYAPALVGQARIKAAAGDVGGARSLVDAALAASPTLGEAWTLKGDLLLADSRRDEALAAYRKAIEVSPYDMEPRGALAALLLDDRKQDDAVKQVAAMRAISPDHPETLYFEGLMAYRAENFAKARELMQKQLARSPENVPGLVLSAAVAYKLKAYEQAEANLVKALRIDPNQGFARRALISTYLQTARPGKALETLRPVVSQIDRNADMLALAGKVYMQNGDLAEAERYFEKSTALDPNKTDTRVAAALTRLAQGDSGPAFRSLEATAVEDKGESATLALIAAHLARHEYDQALVAIEALEKKYPNEPLAHNLGGIALLGKGDKTGARQSFERAVALNPLYTPAVEALARLDLGDNKPAVARRRFDAVLAKDPNNVRALLWIADLRSRTGGSADEVAALIGKAISAGPDQAAPRLALIEIYARHNDPKRALSAAQDAQRAMPDNPEIVEALGRAELAAGETNQAVSTYVKLTQLAPRWSLAWLRLAQAQTAGNDKAAAIVSLKRALEVKPDLALAQHGVVELELQTGRLNDAVAMAREVQKEQPKDPIGYVLEGETHEARKDWTGAAAVYRAALKNVDNTELAIKVHTALVTGRDPGADKFASEWNAGHPRDRTFRLYLAGFARERKDYADAAKQYQAVLEITPDNPLVLNNLAWVSGQLKDPKAIGYAEQANRLAPNQPNIMDTLGTLLVEKGETARGVDLLQKASSTAPEDATIRLNFAKGLVRAGRTSDARKELETLAKLGDRFPMHAEVAQMLKSL